MIRDESFEIWLGRVRQGDEKAAAHIVRHFEPELRRVIRLRLTDPFLRRLYDSADICQSVMGNFFLRLQMGQFNLDNPKNLLGLLVTMARNKMMNLARDKKREKHARLAPADAAPGPIEQAPADADSVGHMVANQELFQRARLLLESDERKIVDLRLAGAAWNDIADECGDRPDAVRKRYTRALERIGGRLGLVPETKLAEVTVPEAEQARLDIPKLQLPPAPKGPP